LVYFPSFGISYQVKSGNPGGKDVSNSIAKVRFQPYCTHPTLELILPCTLTASVTKIFPAWEESLFDVVYQFLIYKVPKDLIKKASKLSIYKRRQVSLVPNFVK
jgi:hypothetical protein